MKFVLVLKPRAARLAFGGTDNNLDYLEVVHVHIQRSNQGSPALPEAGQAFGSKLATEFVCVEWVYNLAPGSGSKSMAVA